MNMLLLIIQTAYNFRFDFIQITKACKTNHSKNTCNSQRHRLIYSIERFIRLHNGLKRLGQQLLLCKLVKGNTSEQGILNLSFLQHSFDTIQTLLHFQITVIGFLKSVHDFSNRLKSYTSTKKLGFCYLK
ncbi:hypothetical protein D3C78_1117100 [compost metagenome]